MIVLNDVSTWPSDVTSYMEENHSLFLNWEQNGSGSPRSEVEVMKIVRNYDNAINGLRDVLNAYHLHGYHCTRLADYEISHIKSKGMQPPNLQVLKHRIQTALDQGLVSNVVARMLEDQNQANDSNRAGMIWFCFFKPYIAGESGLCRFFRSWGGEALYNHHERNPTTGPILQQIGKPCVVEAKVPIRDLSAHGGVECQFVRQFLVDRGLKTKEPLEHEDRAIRSIFAENIIRITTYCEQDFVALTRCDTWSIPVA